MSEDTETADEDRDRETTTDTDTDPDSGADADVRDEEGADGSDGATDDGLPDGITRRATMAGLGIAGLLGFGATTASADPQGQVGTSSDPLRSLYAQTAVTTETRVQRLTSAGTDNGLSIVSDRDVRIETDANGNGTGGTVRLGTSKLRFLNGNDGGELFAENYGGPDSSQLVINTFDNGTEPILFRQDGTTRLSVDAAGDTNVTQQLNVAGDLNVGAPDAGGFVTPAEQNLLFQMGTDDAGLIFGQSPGGDNNGELILRTQDDGDEEIKLQQHNSSEGAAPVTRLSVDGAGDTNLNGNALRNVAGLDGGGTGIDLGDDLDLRGTGADMLLGQDVSGTDVTRPTEAHMLFGMAGSDAALLFGRAGSGGSDDGEFVVRTQDNGSEPIKFQQHDSKNGNPPSTRLQIDSGGNTDFRGNRLRNVGKVESSGPLRVDTPTRSTDEVRIAAPATGNVGTGDLANSEIAFALDEANTGVDVYVNDSGGVTGSAEIASYSTRRLKTDVRPFEGDPTDVLGVEAETFTAGDGDGERRLGITAESAHEAGLEHLVEYAPVEDAWQTGAGIDESYLAAYGRERDGETVVPNDVNERAWLAMHHELLRDLETGDRERRIADLEADLAAAEARVEDQANRIDRLESTVDRKDDRIDDLEAEAERLREDNERLRERNAELEARIERIEDRLGIDDTSGVSDRRPADD